MINYEDLLLETQLQRHLFKNLISNKITSDYDGYPLEVEDYDRENYYLDNYDNEENHL